MVKKRVVWFLAPVLAAGVLAACSDKDSTPSNPANPSPVTGDATLKTGAPAAVSPVSDAVEKSRTPTLIINNVSGTYATAQVTYQFQVQDEGGGVFEESLPVKAGSGGKTAYTMRNRLGTDKKYTWTARSVYQGAYGPWSAKAAFRSPKTPEAYMTDSELYEPLIEGSRSRFVHSAGHAEWFEGLGVKLLDRYGWVQWVLAKTLVEGEVSFEATGIRKSSEEWKTKIMSMEDWGAGNTTDNPYRVTVDKRSEWLGQGSRIRFTMRSRGNDAGEPAGRKGQEWVKANTYGWRFTWRGGTAHLWVYDGGFGGRVKEHLQTEYDAPYEPLHHCVRLGSPFGRNQKETLPNVVIRHLWVSANPRPDDLGK